jgi:hypothetical protein
MLSGMGTVNLSQLEAAFNTDLGDQQNPLQTGQIDPLSHICSVDGGI